MYLISFFWIGPCPVYVHNNIHPSCNGFLQFICCNTMVDWRYWTHLYFNPSNFLLLFNVDILMFARPPMDKTCLSWLSHFQSINYTSPYSLNLKPFLVHITWVL